MDRDSFIKGRPIAQELRVAGGDNPYNLLDEDWVKTAFMISDAEFTDATDAKNRYWSTASAKFTDTSIGGNVGINHHPQYTPYADWPVPGRLQGRETPSPSNFSGNYGWGAYASEAIDDQKQIIFMRMGVPQFNSLINYLSRAFDPASSMLARTGRMPGVFYNTGKAIGTFAAVQAFPVVAFTILAGKFVNFFFARSTSKFYTMKPTMHTYWSTVNSLVNTIAVNIGIYPKILNMNADNSQKLGRPFVLDQEYLSQMSSLMPDVFRGNSNYFDVFALANRAQRIANAIHSAAYDKADQGTTTDYVGYLKTELSGNGTHSNEIVDRQGNISLANWLDETLKLSKYFKSEKSISGQMETDPKIDTDSAEGKEKTTSWASEYAAYFDAEFRSGSQFATFCVDYTGPQTTSWSNTAVESEMQQKLNQSSAEKRALRFAFAEGNILGDTVSSVIGAAGDLAMGVIDGVTMNLSSVIKGLMGDGFLDVPKHWQSSSVSLPRTSYSMTLKATYNTPMSRMLKIYIPICMILAAALPRSTGKQSYTSPYLVQIFDKGRNQIRLGMIESLSITAGSGANIGFDSRGVPLAFDVNFTVADLSSIMHMPVSSGDFLGTDMTLDEDNILSDYLAVLSSQDMYNQIYPMPALRLRAAKLAINVGKWQSPAFWAAATHNSATDGLLQIPTLGLGNLLDSLTRAPAVTSINGS